MNNFWNGFNSLAQQIQVEEIRNDEPTFADWAEYQQWLDSLPADEPLYFPADDE